ncbi:MAG: OprD family outer membrane porin [Campylobacterota bacterium]|nr:OprD family outer membrane porin [Campylobacterota bacterium]
MKINKVSLAVITALSLVSSAQATLKSDKVTLKGNMVVKYTKLPSSVTNINNIFSDGVFYGRLRTNSFMWDWNDDSKFDNKALGVGGSFIYKTAPFAGFSATAGLYTSQNPSFFREDVVDVGLVKAGKDTFSRNDTANTNNFGMSVLGQAYLQYDVRNTSLVVGRQLFESVFTKSNDTKMIPNTFDGVSATIKDIRRTTIQLAYFDKQKLRDHTVSHDVLAVNGWSQNDDSAVNKNLTIARIGDDNSLVIGSITNKSIKNLKTNISYAMVPDVVSNLTFEAHYAIPIAGKWKVIPGVRYMQQFDDLNADYDVANLKANPIGYTDSKSLDSNLLAVRLDIKNDAFLARFGYSQIADEADIVAPWRGFPTGGFTRAMAQYNWYANTKTYMARVGYDFSKAKIINGFSIMARYAVQDFDDTKAGVQADTNILHIDARQNIGKNLEAKLRIGLVSDEDTAGKADVSYNEYRVELNYFF